MGKAYSINGYLNAALRRTGKTLLVEGPTDKLALHRIAIERYPETAGSVAIDHAGMLDDAQLTGLGNKARVLHVQTCSDALKATVPKIEAVLATLIDREWDGILFNYYLPEPGWAEPVQHPNRFTTLGHSIENYHFDLDCAKEYLKFGFAEHVSAQLFAELEARFSAILVLSSVLSLKIKDDACVSRCASLIDISHLNYQNQRYHLAPSFGIACATRGLPTAVTIVTDVNVAIDAIWDQLHTSTAIKWIPHGHIGDDILWTSVAHVTISCGVPLEIAKEVAHGRKKDRERFKAQWLSSALAEKRVPLDQSVDWLHT